MSEPKPITIQDIEQDYPELFKDIFMRHLWYGHISKFSFAAKEAGYKFFCWNDVIYDTTTLQIITELRQLGVKEKEPVHAVLVSSEVDIGFGLQNTKHTFTFVKVKSNGDKVTEVFTTFRSKNYHSLWSEGGNKLHNALKREFDK